MKMRSTKFGWIVAMVLPMLLVAFALPMALANELPPADAWGVSSTASGESDFSVIADGSASVTVAISNRTEQSFPVVADLLVGGSDPSNMFTGNLAAQNYSGVSFRINGDGTVPLAVQLVLYQRYGTGRYVTFREWVHRGVAVSAVPGEWTIVHVPFDLEKGWSTTYESNRYTTEQLWAMDMRDVKAMILRIVASGLDAQAYSVADFRLAGDGVISEPARLTSMQMLLAQCGVTSIDQLTPQMLKWDSDGDGMSDFSEILAGMDPYDASSVFQARVAVGPGGNRISWDGVLGLRYGVMRSNNLTEGFELIATGIAPTRTGIWEHVDPSPVEGMPNFYKVVKY